MIRKAALLGIAAVQLAVAQPSSSSAPALKLLAEIDVSGLSLPSHGAPLQLTVRALAFSPDENWIGVAMSPAPSQVGRNTSGTPAQPDSLTPEYLYLLPLHDPPNAALEIDPGMAFHFGWSPNSNRVILGGTSLTTKTEVAKLYNLKGEEIWKREDLLLFSLPAPTSWSGTYGFLDAEHLLAQHISPKGQLPGLDVTDLQGRVIDSWIMPKNWMVRDISPDRGLLAVFPDDQAHKTMVVDYPAKKVVQSRANFSLSPTLSDLAALGAQAVGRLGVYFAESGKTLCSVGVKAAAECWDVDTNKRVAEFHRFLGGWAAVASIRGSRLLMTQGSRFPGKGGKTASSAGLVVWDFRSGGEVANWSFETPIVSWPNHPGAPVFTLPVAISATGGYVAFGAGSVVRIYQLPGTEGSGALLTPICACRSRWFARDTARIAPENESSRRWRGAGHITIEVFCALVPGGRGRVSSGAWQ